MDRTRNLKASVRVALVAIGAWVVILPVVAADDLCGATVVSNLKLDHDLTCTGDGLIVGADGIKINLNGHTIAGAGTGIGINVSGRTNVSITGGTVQNFATGVLLVTSTAIVVRENHFVGNGDGIDVRAGSVGNTIKENHFSNSLTRGIMLRGGTSANIVRENVFTENRVGILLFGAVGTTLKENVISLSGLAGIRVNVLASGNLILENTVASNPAGIDFIVTATGSATGNTLRENTIVSNTCGLNGPLDGNIVTENLFQANTADVCP